MEFLDNLTLWYNNFFPVEDPLLFFGILMAAVFLFPPLSEKLKLPSIVGCIVAGILIGPFGLGLLPEENTALKLLSELGLLYIMFTAGLEIDLHQVKKNKKGSLSFGLLTFFIPLILGTTAAMVLLGMSFAPGILLASMFSSHTLLTYPIVSRFGLSKSPVVTTTIGGTIITDTLAMVVLAVVAGASDGDLNLYFWLRFVGLSLLYSLGILFLLPKIGRWFFQRNGSNEEAPYLFILLLVTIIGWLAHPVGLEPIIGAFLIGLALNSFIPENSTLMSRIHFIGNTLFIPIFLVSVGMLIDLRILFESSSVWLVAGVMVGAGLITKYLAALLAQKYLGHNTQEGLLIFGMSVNQAAATLAAVKVGMNLEIFNQDILSGTIVMIMVTTFVGSLVTNLAGRKVALAESNKPYDPTLAPYRILIPIANKERFEHLVDLGLMLRDKGSKEPLFPIHCIQDGQDLESRVAKGEKLLTQAISKITASGASANPLTRVHSHPAEGILQSIKDLRISTIVAGWNGQMSSHGHIFGQTLDTLIQNSRQMVLVNKVNHSLSTLQRFILIIPPLVHRQPGFSSSFKSIKDLCSQSGNDLVIRCPQEVNKIIQELNEQLAPALPYTYHPYERWAEVLPQVMASYHSQDHVVLISARQGRGAWQPRLDRWPRELLKAREEANITILYPPEEEWTPSTEGPQKGHKEYLEQIFSPGGFSIQVPKKDWREGIQSILFSFLEHTEQSALFHNLSQSLIKVGEEEPVELVAGVVLIHAHVEGLPSKILLCSTFAQEQNMDHVPNPVHTLILLLVPQDQAPESHLRTLGQIIQFVQIPGLPALLKEAKTLEDFNQGFSALYEK